MQEDVDSTALELAELLPGVAVNLRVAALFDTTVADLTANQLVTLLLVGQSEGARLRAGDVARRLAISPASATALVDRLVEAGVLSRTRGEDRRVVWVSLTEDGRILIDRLRAGMVARISAALVGSTADAREHLVQSLRRVASFANDINESEG